MMTPIESQTAVPTWHFPSPGESQSPMQLIAVGSLTLL